MCRLPQSQLALEEMRRSYDLLINNADSMDQKASWLLGSSSWIVALFGLLQLTALPQGQSSIYCVGIVLVIACYGGLVWICVSVLRPRSYKYPITADWDTISNGILQSDHEAAYHKAISSYVEQIPNNRRINEGKARGLRIGTILLGFMITALLLLGFVVQ